VNYAEAYLRSIDKLQVAERPLEEWPYKRGSQVNLFVLAGHRNMEGERAFVQDLATLKGGEAMRRDEPRIAYRYSVGGGVKVSDGWEPLGVAGPYDTFGPEVSFGRRLLRDKHQNIAIAKFTHSGSQIIDWTKAGSVAKSRNLYPQLLEFIRSSVADLKAKGHRVKLCGVYYHLGENDMSWHPFRRGAAERLQALVADLRKDLKMRKLQWVVSQQQPTDDKDVNSVDVVADVAAVAAADPYMVHVKAFDLPPQEKKLVLDTAAVVRLGELLAESVPK